MKAALLERMDGILVGLAAIVIVGMFCLGSYCTAAQKHDECVQALKTEGVGDTVRLSLCRQ